MHRKVFETRWRRRCIIQDVAGVKGAEGNELDPPHTAKVDRLGEWSTMMAELALLE